MKIGEIGIFLPKTWGVGIRHMAFAIMSSCRLKIGYGSLFLYSDQLLTNTILATSSIVIEHDALTECNQRPRMLVRTSTFFNTNPVFMRESRFLTFVKGGVCYII